MKVRNAPMDNTFDWKLLPPLPGREGVGENGVMPWKWHRICCMPMRHQALSCSAVIVMMLLKRLNTGCLR